MSWSVEFRFCQCRDWPSLLIQGGNRSTSQCDLIFDVLHGVLEFPVELAGLRFNATRISFSRIEVRLCRIDSRFLDGDYDLIWLPVEFDKKIPCLHDCCHPPEPLTPDPAHGPPQTSRDRSHRRHRSKRWWRISQIQGTPNTAAIARTTAASAPSANAAFALGRDQLVGLAWRGVSALRCRHDQVWRPFRLSSACRSSLTRHHSNFGFSA